MTRQAIVAKTVKFVQTKFVTAEASHDWWHVYRVWQLSKAIAAKEQGADMFIVELGALLHDIADWKFHDGDLEAGPKAARAWLQSLSVDEAVISHIEDIVRGVTFRGAGVATTLKTLEGKIVQDADRLDALGAIGIARAFAYGGAQKRPLYDPAVSPEKHDSFEAYQANRGTTINHFYEKLLLLKDRLNTKTARTMANRRHKYMEQFLAEFYAEWDGKR